MADSFLRVDGEEHRLSTARLLWQPAACEGREGILFQATAHGARTVLHVSAWAPGTTPDDLSGQTVTITSPGPDAALDGRLFGHATVRFGRVRADRVVLSLDGAIDPMEPEAPGRARVEADLRGSVQSLSERAHCLGCGRPLGGFAVLRDTYVGGFRLRVRSLPWRCPDCEAAGALPAHCPTCGDAYAPDGVRTSSDEETGDLGFTAACENGHVVSGRLEQPQ